MPVEIFNNAARIVRDDLEQKMEDGCRISAAASCFSLYAYQALRERLRACGDFRFIFTAPAFIAEKARKESREFYIPRARKNVQDYVFADGYAKDGQSVERRFAEDMDSAAEVCVYAKLPKGFSIPTPVGHYSPDWAIAFNKGTVKHIFFIAETKGTMDSLNLRPVEQAKIKCAKKLFNELSAADVVYHDVTNYQDLMTIMNSL